MSRVALGVAFRAQGSSEEAQRVIEHAIDSGINLIDCANSYRLLAGHDPSQTRSEVVLGKAIQARRDDVVITTKVWGAVGEGPNDSGLSRLHIMREVERSLRSLSTDYIDIYLLHNFDQMTPIEETLRALDDLVKSGKVRYIGCCNFAAWQVCKAMWTSERINAAPFICVQNNYSLLNRAVEGEMFGLIRDQRLGAMAYSPLAVGLLSGIYTPGEKPPTGSLLSNHPDDVDLMTALATNWKPVYAAVSEIARERDKTPAQVALNWVLSHPEITVAISGSDNIAQVDENIGSIGWHLTKQETSLLDQVSRRPSLHIEK